MIDRISIRDFAVAREVTFAPGPGLNAFTGETGAGKSLVVDALAFAFGSRKGREVIAHGAERATVEVTVTLPSGRHVVERTVGLSGRSTIRVDGETAALAALEDLGTDLIDIHGQSGQLAILRPSVQLRALDEFASLHDLRREFASLVRDLRDLRRRIDALQTDARERERLVAQLAFETAEIDDAALVPGEDEALRADHLRLGNASRLIEDAARALDALAEPAIGELSAAVADLTARDRSATELADLAALFDSAAADLGRALRHYRDSIDADPAALTPVEERLDLIARLRRKYGDTVEDILAYAADAHARLAVLTSADESIDALRTREAELLPRLADLGARLSSSRRAAASTLVTAIHAELAGLGMPGASIAIALAADDDPAGIPIALPDYDLITGEPASPSEPESHLRAFSESGFDRVEFLASFNPGESPRPLGAVASGGETSRFLLAVATVLAASGPPRLVVFDEVDEGVGGRAGALVGAALSRLAGRHQVFCVTHLPQVAAFAPNHFVVEKTTTGARTHSTIHPIEGEARITELASMLGADTPPNRAAAHDLLANARPPEPAGLPRIR